MGVIKNAVARAANWVATATDIWASGRAEYARRFYSGESLGGTGTGDVSYESVVEWGYMRNAWSYRCINLIASATAALPWIVVKRDGEVIDDHPMLRLFGQAEADTGALPVIERHLTYNILGGESYMMVASPDSGTNEGRPNMLWPLPTNAVQVVPDQNMWGLIANFKVGGETITTKNMAQFQWAVNPLNPYTGISPAEAAFLDLRVNTLIAGWYLGTLQNAGRQSGQMLTEATSVSPKVREAAEEFVQRYLQGATNAGKIIVPPQGYEIKPMSMTPLDMGLAAIESVSRVRIFTAYGVPPEVVGDHEHATYSNYEQASQGLYHDTILPIARRFAAKINTWLAPRFGPDVRLAVNVPAVEALQEDSDSLAARVKSLVEAGIQTRNEGRVERGLEEVGPEGDVLTMPANMVPVSQVTGEGSTTPQVGE